MVICNVHVFVRFVQESLHKDDGHGNENGKKAISWRPGTVYTRRFAATIFRTTQRCNVGTMLWPFETMSQQCCNVVLRWKSSLRIVSCNVNFLEDGSTRKRFSFSLQTTSKTRDTQIATRVTDGCRPRFARLAALPLPRAWIALTKSEEKERLFAVYFLCWS